MKDLKNAKQKELIELLDRYFLSKTKPSLDELIEYEDLKSELAALEQEEGAEEKQCHICGGIGKHTGDCGATYFIDLSSKEKPDLHNIVFGPGDDNYGRNIPPWKKQQLNQEAEEFIIKKFKIDIMPNEFTFFHEKLFELMQEYVQQSRREVNDILECISKFDDKVIQKDVRNLKPKP